MKNIFLLFYLIILSGCTIVAKYNMDLTILQDGSPKRDYDVLIKMPASSAAAPISPHFNSREIFTVGKYKTDKNGQINVDVQFWTKSRQRHIRKPMFMISSANIKNCLIVPWYMEKERFFIALQFDESIGEFVGAVPDLNSVTGNFERVAGGGWRVTATIHNLNGLCDREKEDNE